MFNKTEIANYYNQTNVHYQVMWQLDKSLGLHYGIWYKDTENLHAAIQNSNKVIGSFIDKGVKANVLDAGCGVGGTSLFLAQNYGCKVTGITLSPVQYRKACEHVKTAKLEDQVSFAVADYTKTSFEDNTFDLVFGIESICHAPEKSEVYKEAFRILKPGGKLVITDSYKTEIGYLPKNQKTLEWGLNRWAIDDIDGVDETKTKLEAEGFSNVGMIDHTLNIKETIDIIYRRAFWGIITIPIYAIFYPTKYIFARRHPESGWAVHKAYRKKLFKYCTFSAVKPLS